MDSLPQEFLCPISLEVMVDPVVAVDGHSYERANIAAWFNAHDSSPLTNLKLEHKHLIPNITLKSTIQSYLNSHRAERTTKPETNMPNVSATVEQLGSNKPLFNNQQAINPSATSEHHSSECKNEQTSVKHVSYSGLSGRYEGQLVNGKKHGKGVQTLSSGERYVGDWSNDRKHGRGVTFYANGDKYDGEYANGKKQGRGFYSMASGQRYVGYWRDDRINGYGIYSTNDGNIYKGEFNDGRRHGRGTLTNTSGREITGEWRHDQLVSQSNV